MADQAFGCPEQIVEANAEADLLDNLVRVLCIDVVLDGHNTPFPKVVGRNLDKVCDLGLGSEHISFDLGRMADSVGVQG